MARTMSAGVWQEAKACFHCMSAAHVCQADDSAIAVHTLQGTSCKALTLLSGKTLVIW